MLKPLFRVTKSPPGYEALAYYCCTHDTSYWRHHSHLIFEPHHLTSHNTGPKFNKSFGHKPYTREYPSDPSRWETSLSANERQSSRSELCNIDSIDFSHRYPEIYSLHVILKATSLRSTVNRWVRFTSKERHRTRSLKHLPKGQRLTSTNSGCTHRQQHGLKPLYPALQPVVSALAEYKRS